MKKLVMLLIAASMTAAVSAQTNYDPATAKRKVLEVDNLMSDTRNHAKAQNWMLKGDTYYAAAMEPIKGLAKSMTKDDLIKVAGPPSSMNEATIKGDAYDVYVYGNYDVYFPKGRNLASFWVQKTVITPDAVDVAVESFIKAYDIQKSLKERAKSRLITAYDEYKREADMAIPVGDNKTIRDGFAKAYELGKHPLVDNSDSLLAYNAGQISILLEDWDTAIKYLEEAKARGLENNGEVYRLLYFAYTGKKDDAMAEKALMDGLAKYPGQTDFIELLLTLYSSSGKDISQLTKLIEEALAKNPNSYNLNFGMGMILDKTGDYAGAIKYFSKTAEISPNEYGPFFNWGVTQGKVADVMVNELNQIPPTKPDEYMAKYNEVLESWKTAVVPLEKALELRPGDQAVTNLLMGFYLRLKDQDPEMAAKYEKLSNQ